jgi:hypothetical protein
MSLVARLDVSRADRFAIDRVGTLRDHAKVPMDVVIDNLSNTGCLFALDRELLLGELVSLGLPGIGVHQARISRAEHPNYACAFLTRVSDQNISAARSAETLVASRFPHAPASVAPIMVQPLDEQLTGRELPLSARIAIIAGFGAALWSVIIAGIFAVVR